MLIFLMNKLLNIPPKGPFYTRQKLLSLAQKKATTYSAKWHVITLYSSFERLFFGKYPKQYYTTKISLLSSQATSTYHKTTYYNIVNVSSSAGQYNEKKEPKTIFSICWTIVYLQLFI